MNTTTNKSEDNEQVKVALVIRPKAISRYRILSCLMFGFGFLTGFIAVYAADMFHRTVYGVPYYVGSLISAVSVLALSFVGGAVYYKGQNIGKASYIAPLILQKTRPFMLVFIILSPFMLVLCLVGLILTGVYGLCAGDQCSYAVNESMNLGLAAFLFCLQLISVMLIILSIVNSIYYGRYFGVSLKPSNRRIEGTISVKPQHDEFQEALQIYTLQKWKITTDTEHMSLDFQRISDYREQAKKAQRQQSAYVNKMRERSASPSPRLLHVQA